MGGNLWLTGCRTNIGRVFFPAVQCVAAFATSYPEIWGDAPTEPRKASTASIPCLIPCAIDQDPYFRLLRDNAHRMRNPSPKPALIHSQFLTALQGPGGKMSASDPNSAIFMSDTAKEVQKKINKYAFSGGRVSVEEHREHGGNPDVDVSYQYLTYFMEDDRELGRIRSEYKKGNILTGELKKMCIEVMQEYVGQFQARRKVVTDDTLMAYMTPRRLIWKGNPNPNPDAGKPLQPSITVDGAELMVGAEDEERRMIELRRATTVAGDGMVEQELKQKRPGLASIGRKSTFGGFAVRGLSSYGDSISEMIYPTRSVSERAQ